MSIREKSEIREPSRLTAAELEEVTGGNTCATGAHFDQVKLTVRNEQAPRTPVAYFGGVPIY